MKAVLDLAGEYKKNQPRENEIRIIKEAILRILKPKLLLKDIKVIIDLINDLFPGINQIQ